VTNISGGVKQGGAKVWIWDFGDGNNSYAVNFTNVNVTHTYTNVSLYTVSLTYENICCNNTTIKTNYIDIRDIPAANFTASPTSGLVPLYVQFNDTSTGNPSSWEWRFPLSEGNSSLQNPNNTYYNKGNYTVKLNACNFCGCNWSNKTNLIHAGAPSLYFSPEPLVVPTNDTTPLTLFLEVAENGLTGYDLDVFWCDSYNGNITAVEFPSWAVNTSNTTLPNYSVQIVAVDLFEQIYPGEPDVKLATFNLTGSDFTTYPSSICFNVSVNYLTDIGGMPIDNTSIPAQITVVRLLPFPGMNSTDWPTDPDPTDPQIYWDVNGNDHVDFADVVLYFNNMQWIRDNQYIPFFDYNGNLQIDFADLILLFNKVPYP
jgi:PKD repeat protein